MTPTGDSAVYWLGAPTLPPNLVEATAGLSVHCPSVAGAAEALGVASVAVLDDQTARTPDLLRRLAQGGAVCVVLGPPQPGPAAVLYRPADCAPAELRATILAARDLHPALEQATHRAVEAEAAAREALRTAEEIDEEMRLASRLQQDFMPRRLPVVGNVRFAVHCRPVGFVSGDIYDVARIDENHVGFYVADAVGHGMPAALMTMFIKEALQTKKITEHSYQIIPPDDALAGLNHDLCGQQLSMCEFCTAMYGVIDADTAEITLSRAGHPLPLRLSPGEPPEPIDLPGGLLGVFPDAVFESCQLSLAPGQKLLIYSDGLEDCLCGTGASRSGELIDVLAPLADLPRVDLLGELADRVENANPDDDVTILLVEHEHAPRPTA